MKKTILCFVAHCDDEAIGIGATAAKYIKEGLNVVMVVFSYGEVSHIKKGIIIKRRVKESKDAGKILGYKNIIFFGLPDANISKNVDKVKDKIIKLIKKYKPVKIFTHSPNDPLPDHKAVNKIVNYVLEEMDSKIDLYGFDIWNITNLSEAENPRMYVDVTKTFDLKINALKAFKSQRHVMLQMIPAAYSRARLAGDHLGCKYAERFYKLR